MRLKILFVFLVLGVLCSSAWAVIGPSTAGLNKGQWSLGYNYSYSKHDLDRAKATSNEGDVYQYDVEDLAIQRHYGTLSYGVADWWELYASVGVADVKEHETYDDVYEYSTNFDNDLAWGWGTRITFAKGEKVSWGVAVQMNWLDTDWSDDYDAGSEELSLESYDVLVSVGPTIDMGGWKLYFGPFYYCFNGDYDYTDEYDDEGPVVYKESATVREDTNFGGRVGVLIPVAQNWDLTAEAAMISGGWGLGGGLAWKF